MPATPHPAQVALGSVYRQISNALHARALGLPCQAPDWMDPAIVHAVACELSEGAGGAPLRWELVLALRDGLPTGSLPRSWHLGPGHHALPLRCLQTVAAQAQAAPGMLRRKLPEEAGTATCLVRDRLNPDRNYLLGCGHVLAPDAAARWGDDIGVDAPLDTGAVQRLQARLREWLPLPGSPAHSTIDAALAEIDSAAAQLLWSSARLWMPAGLSDNISAGREVVLKRRDGELRGTLRLLWSGQVSLPDEHGASEYFLRDAVGYTTTAATEGGDSGAPIWTDDEALLGMHIGAIEPSASFGANAVLGRIAPVLDWFQVKPYTRLDPATLDPRAPLPSGLRQAAPDVAALLQSPADEVRTVAQTLWGEARGEQQAGMEAVACVIVNRWRRQYRGKTTPSEVCTDPQQFSCWNRDDPNRKQMERLNAGRGDAEFDVAVRVAAQALGGGIADVTQGALHYVARTLRKRPDWLNGKLPCAVIGGHEFYNNVA